MTALAAVQDRPDSTQLAAESAALVAQATAIAITDPDSYLLAVEFGKGAQALRKRIVDFFSPHKKRAKAVHDELCADEKRQLDGPDRAVVIIKAKVLDYQRAERERLAAEQRRRDELARKLEEERQLAEAVDLEESGDSAGAEEVFSRPIETPPVAVPRLAAPKVSGVATPKRWTFEESKVDLAAVLRHIVGVPPGTALAHPELLRVACLDTKVTRQLITAMRENFNVPGIAAYEAESVALGSK